MKIHRFRWQRTSLLTSLSANTVNPVDYPYVPYEICLRTIKIHSLGLILIESRNILI